MELRAAKGWLIFLTLFEVPEIYKVCVGERVDSCVCACVRACVRARVCNVCV